MNAFLQSTRKIFAQYKGYADKTFAQLKVDQLNWQPDHLSNSIAIIVRHINGNLRSRFTDFLSTDGEKPWRNRDAEFEGGYSSQEEMLMDWEGSWSVLFSLLDDLNEDDLSSTVLIRNEPHTVTDAIQRQLAHYASHIGQIIYIGKMIKQSDWKTLSIPRGGSAAFNQEKSSGKA